MPWLSAEKTKSWKDVIPFAALLLGLEFLSQVVKEINWPQPQKKHEKKRK